MEEDHVTGEEAVDALETLTKNCKNKSTVRLLVPLPAPHETADQTDNPGDDERDNHSQDNDEQHKQQRIHTSTTPATQPNLLANHYSTQKNAS